MTAIRVLSSQLNTSAPECTQISRINLDEVETTDRVRNLPKLGKSIARRISLVRRSLSRKNSNLSLASSILETGSSHSMISLDSVSESSDSIEYCKPIRSCMKGTTTRKRSNQYVVRFQKHSRNNVFIIAPYFAYAADLWYTTPQEKALLAMPQIHTENEEEEAGRLMAAYVTARKQVYPRKWFEMNAPSTSSSYMRMLTDSYDDIVEGRRSGLAGFEQYSPGIMKRRQGHIRSVVLMICTFYYDCKINNLNSVYAKTGMKPKTKSDGTLSSKTIAEVVRNYSKSLSECDRYWATAIGRADYDAIDNMYQQFDDTNDVVERLHTSTPMEIGTVHSRNSMSNTTIGSGCHLVSDNEDDDDDIEEFY